MTPQSFITESPASTMIATMSSAIPTNPCPPVLTFTGPDSASQIKAFNTNGTQIASFIVDGSKNSFTISRHTGNSTPLPICTSNSSSLSSNKNMTIHGQEATMKSDGMQYIDHFEAKTLNGILKWQIKYTQGTRIWTDGGGNVVAKAYKNENKMEIFVAGDEMIMDRLLAGWVAINIKHKPSTTEKSLVTGLKIVGHLMGGAGA